MRGYMLRTAPLLMGLVLCTAWQPVSAQNSQGLPAPGAVRPDTVYGRIGEWFAVRNLEGATTQFPSLHDRVLFVNFWATWCAPCVEEMPTITEMAGAMDESDVAFLLISIDDDERDVRRFIERQDPGIPVYVRNWQPGESTFTAGIVPATFIVNKEGEIVYQHHGAANWNAESIRHFLMELARR